MNRNSYLLSALHWPAAKSCGPALPPFVARSRGLAGADTPGVAYRIRKVDSFKVVPQRHHHEAAKNSPAYTLIELLIVLVLISLLMVGIWALLKNWGGLYERGHRRTQRALLVRSLSDQFTDDLHDVTYRPPARAGKGRSRASPASLGNAVGLVGEKDWMVLDILQSLAPYHAAPRPQGAEMPQRVDEKDQWVVRSPELQRVVYWFQAHEDTVTDPLPENESPPFYGLLRLAVAREYFTGIASLDGGETPVSRGSSSLRSEVELICQTVTAPEDADVAGVDSSAMTSTDTASPDVGRPVWLPGVLQQDEITEVGWLEFRYFDGTTWQTSWDSRTDGRLPVAVEVKFELVDPPDENAAALTDEQQAEADLRGNAEEQSQDELNNAALLEGQAPEWADQSTGLSPLAADAEEGTPYYRCVVYLEPPKEWPESPTETDVTNEADEEPSDTGNQSPSDLGSN